MIYEGGNIFWLTFKTLSLIHDSRIMSNYWIISFLYIDHEENYLLRADRVLSLKCYSGVPRGFRSVFQREARAKKKKKKKHEDSNPDTTFELKLTASSLKAFDRSCFIE